MAINADASDDSPPKRCPNDLTCFLIFLFVCNIALFVALLVYHDADNLQADKDKHIQSMLDTNNKADWDVEAKKADGLAYSNLWFVLLIPVYFMLTHSNVHDHHWLDVLCRSDTPIEATKKKQVQLVSNSAKLRAVLICVLCVCVALVSAGKHAFESHSMLPGDPGKFDGDPMADPDSTNNRIYCQVSGKDAFAFLARDERSASYVYSCLPSFWATKIDWFLARVCMYAIPFLAVGLPEMCYVYLQDWPILHGTLQMIIALGFAICVCMDIMQMVQETIKSATELALKSVIFSSICIGGPILLALSIYCHTYITTANRVQRQLCCSIPLDVLIRTLLLVVLVVLASLLWVHDEDKYRYAHVVWHVVCGTIALTTLSLCCDWAKTNSIANSLASKTNMRTSHKRHKHNHAYTLVTEL